MRIEDLDPPREEPGAARQILRTLEIYGLHWDGEVVYQSRRRPAYEWALGWLIERQYAYLCRCSRKTVKTAAGKGRYGPVYPGACRPTRYNKPAAQRSGQMMRVLTHDRPIRFEDSLLGPFSQRLESEIGDFVILRRDGHFAYQLAVVVDDAWQGVTEIVRGTDLLDSTCRQIYLQQLLDLPAPHYLHLPVAVNAAGQKLSKQTRAPALPLDDPRPALVATFRFLNQAPPRDLRETSLESIWKWAIAHWQPDRIPRQRTLLRTRGLSAKD